ncbi:MAG: trypsin-like peptidase domain-containing protein [Chloroflexi bacterium]|nr:trypsin-like peptidase domain-containing protein [Chloroflexota bacterium]
MLAVLFLFGSIAWACTGAAPTAIPGPTIDIEAAVAAAVKAAIPTPDTRPTPDIDATVEARLQAAIAAIPTPIPTPTPRPTITPTLKPAPTPIPSDPYQVIQHSVVKIILKTARGTSQGSGVIVGNGLHVITNAHVIDGAVGGIEVSLHPESGPPLVTDGTIVFQGENIDLALLRIGDPIGRPLEWSRTLPYLGDGLILGGFPGIGGDTLTATKGTVAGFQFDGATIKFDGQLGSGSSGGAAVNLQGKMVGIATRSSGETSVGSLGILLSAPVVSAAVARVLLEDSQTSGDGLDPMTPLSIIGVPAAATVPDGWDIWVTFGYFDMRAPGTTTADPTSDYRVVGIFMTDPGRDESPEDILERLVTESNGGYEIVPNSQIDPPEGFSTCVLVFNDDPYEISNFEARGTVIGTSWISANGLYTRFCVSQTAERTMIGFVESPSREVSAGDGSWLSPPNIILDK